MTEKEAELIKAKTLLAEKFEKLAEEHREMMAKHQKLMMENAEKEQQLQELKITSLGEQVRKYGIEKMSESYGIVISHL